MLFRPCAAIACALLICACGTPPSSPVDASASDVPASDVSASGSPLIDEAIETCAWAEACLSPEAGRGAGAPNAHTSSCLATFFTERMDPRSIEAGGYNAWADYHACIQAHPATCAAFRSCLLGRSALTNCPSAGAAGCVGTVRHMCSNLTPSWGRAEDCATTGLTCATMACTGTCTTNGATCSPDGSRIDRCTGGVRNALQCAPYAHCALFAGAPSCVPGDVGTCTGPLALTCEGDVAVACVNGVSVRLDCARAGKTCSAAHCVDAAQCTYMHDDACSGNTLRVCLSGHERAVDCAALGGTCGMLRSGRPGCVFPEG